MRAVPAAWLFLLYWALLLVPCTATHAQQEAPRAAEPESPPPPPPTFWEEELEQAPQIKPSTPPVVPLFTPDPETLLGRRMKEYFDPSPQSVIKAIFGFVLLLWLAYLASHKRVREFERRLGVAHFATTGLPFLLLGLVASQPQVGILSPPVMREIGPLLILGLGWIGFFVGFRFNAALLDDAPPGTATAVGLATGVPFVAITVLCGLGMLAANVAQADWPLVRDALILGTAGAITARSAPYLWESSFGIVELRRISRLTELERVVGVIGLMLVGAYFRPQGAAVAWQLPGTAWLFITFGVGTMTGGVIYALMAKARGAAEFLVVLLGSIAFAAGLGSFLRLSALVVCFIAGVIVVNLPGGWKGPAGDLLDRLERPIYFLFLTIAGALWDPGDWRGWALMLLFVTARLGGKWLAAVLHRKRGLYEAALRERQFMILGPMGSISLAIVINAQDLFLEERISWIVTAVIGGAILSEILVQAVLRGGPSARPE